MTNQARDKDYLDHIAQAIEKIQPNHSNEIEKIKSNMEI